MLSSSHISGSRNAREEGADVEAMKRLQRMAKLPFQVVKLLPELLLMSIRKRKKPQKLLRAKDRIFAVVFAAKRSKILFLAPFSFFRTKLG
ncbi:CIC11C00000000036 [Sungouiella intermedia]|uniref:CIC11C00000000036 n=1 Tax=Sungouiella intermedia TaxID=45354 RepID=A0A1L0DMJ7_9ASCO|nr:CIC11C00000000036 [[Candida] intermedia]